MLSSQTEGSTMVFGEKKKKPIMLPKETVMIDGSDNEWKMCFPVVYPAGSRSALGKLHVERDFVEHSYEELLSRCYQRIHARQSAQNHGEGGSSDGSSTDHSVSHPVADRLGTRKTVLGNFKHICEQMQRSPKQLMYFFCNELSATGSLNSKEQLQLRGKFTSSMFENTLRKYINEYVTCQACQSQDTSLLKENRILFLYCDSCESRRAVAPIRAPNSSRQQRKTSLRATNPLFADDLAM